MQYTDKESLEHNIFQWILYIVTSSLSMLSVKLNISTNNVIVGYLVSVIRALPKLQVDTVK